VYVRNVEALTAARGTPLSVLDPGWGVFLHQNGHFLWAIVTPKESIVLPGWTATLREGHIREHPPSIFIERPLDEVNESLDCAIRDGYAFGEPPSAEVVSSVTRSSLKREAAWKGTLVGPPPNSDAPVDPYDRIRYITRQESDGWTAWSGEGKPIMHFDDAGAEAMYNERPGEKVKDRKGRVIGYRLGEVETLP